MFDKLLEEYNCLMMEEEELLAIGWHFDVLWLIEVDDVLIL